MKRLNDLNELKEMGAIEFTQLSGTGEGDYFPVGTIAVVYSGEYYFDFVAVEPDHADEEGDSVIYSDEEGFYVSDYVDGEFSGMNGYYVSEGWKYELLVPGFDKSVEDFIKSIEK